MKEFKSTRLRCALCAFALFISHATSAELDMVDPASAGMDPARLQRLSYALQEYVDTEQLAGGVTLVARRGDIVFLEAYGDRDRESADAMQVDSIFRIASQTKAILSTAVMILAEEGELLIQDQVGRYLPEFMATTVAVSNDDGSYEIVPASRAITIRDLLTHTSGFDYGAGTASEMWENAGIQGWYFADRSEPIRETVRKMAALPASAHPGERWIYGYNTDILGALVEVVSGQPLDEFLHDRILDPLGMDDTHFYLPRNKRNRLAAVYSSVDGSLVRAPNDGAAAQGAYLNGPRRSFSGGAGLLSTAEDYASFLQMMLNGGSLDGERILSRKSVELMTTSHLGDIAFNAGQGFGLGFSILEDVGERGSPGSTGEFGWGGAYHSTYWVDPVEQLVVVHLTQLIPANGADDAAKLRSLIYQAIAD